MHNKRPFLSSPPAVNEAAVEHFDILTKPTMCSTYSRPQCGLHAKIWKPWSALQTNCEPKI